MLSCPCAAAYMTLPHPFFAWAFRSAPAATSSRRQTSWPWLAAASSGVQPSLFASPTSAPALISISSTCASPGIAACMAALLPSALRRFRSAPALLRRRRISAWPWAAAYMAGVRPARCVSSTAHTSHRNPHHQQSQFGMMPLLSALPSSSATASVSPRCAAEWSRLAGLGRASSASSSSRSGRRWGAMRRGAPAGPRPPGRVRYAAGTRIAVLLCNHA